MKIAALFVLVVLLTVVYPFEEANAGVPLNNLEGVGGIAFNPLAYTAGTAIESDKKSGEKEGEKDLTYKDVFSKPQFGVWYVNLNDVKVGWTSIGTAETFFKRLEVSYAHEIIAPPGKNIHKDNVGAKLLLLPENFNNNKFLPAVSVGSVWKHANNVAPGVDDSDFDIYGVVTKLITQTPRPVLISGGLLSTTGLATGVFGFDKNRKQVGFANVDILPFDNLAIGFEYKQGARFKDFKNADYWDAHVAWFANKNLSLVLAYVNAGNSKSTSRVGLGEGVVLSAQYAF
ncbi:MAG: DUF3034 family protein [Candidatus Omnitrophota bacterium]|jgi:hypothetical protein